MWRIMEWFIHDINEFCIWITLAILADPFCSFSLLLTWRKALHPGWLLSAPNKVVLLEWKAVTLRVLIHGIEHRPFHEATSRLDGTPLSTVFWCNLVPVGCEVFICLRRTQNIA